jgi:hypothetical protein
MKVAIISDIHNNVVNLKKVLGYCALQKIKTIICCGDLASLETLDFLNDNFSGKIYYTFGNMDEEHLQDYKTLQKYKNIKIYRNFGELKIDNKNISFTHFPDVAKKLAETEKYDYIFYGHTHKPWTEKAGNCVILNPGNVAGEIYPPTFATWNTDDDKFELSRIHNLK